MTCAAASSAISAGTIEEEAEGEEETAAEADEEAEEEVSFSLFTYFSFTEVKSAFEWKNKLKNEHTQLRFNLFLLCCVFLYH